MSVFDCLSNKVIHVWQLNRIFLWKVINTYLIFPFLFLASCFHLGGQLPLLPLRQKFLSYQTQTRKPLLCLVTRHEKNFYFVWLPDINENLYSVWLLDKNTKLLHCLFLSEINNNLHSVWIQDMNTKLLFCLHTKHE